MRTDIPADLEKTQGPRPTDFDRQVREKMMAEQAYVQERMQSQAGMEGAGAMQSRDPLDDLFRYHPPTAEDLPKYAAINQAAKNFAEVLRTNCPTHSADYGMAIMKIREARMMANAAVSLRGRGL